MILLHNEINDEWFYVNPKYPDSPLSPMFNDSALALQWRGRVGQENFGDIEELEKELNALKNGDAVILPKSKEHAESMLRVATFYLETQINE